MQLSNKTVLITGGANGIGKGIAETFIKHKCKVVIFDKDSKGGDEFAKKNPQALFIPVDISKPNEIISAFETVKKSFETIDILINNAGLSKFKPVLELSVEEWDEILNTNLRSAFLCSKEFAKWQHNQTYGRIINIASTRHLMSEPHCEAYAASKGGLVSLTHALAISLQGLGMTVNCISPGWINTGNPDDLCEIDKTQHPVKRVGNVKDIASFCMYLCQPENDFITGQNFYIDGGMTKKMIYE